MTRTIGVLVAAVAIGLGFVTPAIAAPSTDVVIGEVYGGGGNAGATLTSDFIELTNLGTQPVSLAGWSVQYLPGSPSASSRWQTTPLTGSLAPGARYLIGESPGSGGTVALPAPDATGAVAMAATSGTVALVRAAGALTCLTAADCAADASIADLVGYGTATVRETAPAPAPSNTTSVSREAGDTDNNASDFTAGGPTPTNSKGETSGGGTPPVTARIHDVQGTTRVSPLKGQKVGGVAGIVTALRTFGSAAGSG